MSAGALLLAGLVAGVLALFASGPRLRRTRPYHAVALAVHKAGAVALAAALAALLVRAGLRGAPAWLGASAVALLVAASLVTGGWAAARPVGPAAVRRWHRRLAVASGLAALAAGILTLL